MNFEEALGLAVRHRALSRAGNEQYDRLEGATPPPDDQNVAGNRQRLETLSSQAEQKSLAEEQQQQFQLQQQESADDQKSQAEIQEINKAIKAIKENPSITGQEKNDLIHSQEVKKMELAPEVPEGKPPWPKWQDPGMKWDEEKTGAGVKSDGTPWIVTLTRANRGDVTVLYDEKDEHDKNAIENRKLDIEERKVKAMETANENKLAAESGKADREGLKRDMDAGAVEDERSVADAERRAGRIASERANDERSRWQEEQSGKEKPDPQPNWSQVFEQYKAEELQREMESPDESQLAMDAQGPGVIDPATGSDVSFSEDLGAYEVSG